MQGISGRSHSRLLQALNNEADGSLRLARRVKIDEKKDLHPFFTLWVLFLSYNIFPEAFSVQQ